MSVDEFSLSASRIKGTAKSIDMAHVLSVLKRIEMRSRSEELSLGSMNTRDCSFRAFDPSLGQSLEDRHESETTFDILSRKSVAQKPMSSKNDNNKSSADDTFS